MSVNEQQSEPDPVADVLSELPMDEKSLMQRVEAALFLASSPTPSRKLADLASLEDGTQARTVINLLNQHYDEQGRSFHIKQIAGGYQLMTRPQFSTWLRRLEHAPEVIHLSSPAMETLAVVAYRQPVLKAEIEAIRGVHCGEMLRQLLDRGLVSIAGRSEELGRPYFYGTTRKFLQMFGLSRIEALPRAEDLRGRGLPKSVSSTQNESSSPTEPMSTPSNSDTLSFSTESQTPTEETEVSVVDPQLLSENEENSLENAPMNHPSPGMDSPVMSDDEFEDDELEDDELEDEEWEDGDEEDEEYEDEELGEDEEWEEDEDGEWEEGEESDDEEYEDDDEEWDEEDDDSVDDEELEDHWEEVDDDDEEEEEEWEESDDDEWEEDDEPMDDEEEEEEWDED